MIENSLQVVFLHDIDAFDDRQRGRFIILNSFFAIFNVIALEIALLVLIFFLSEVDDIFETLYDSFQSEKRENSQCCHLIWIFQTLWIYLYRLIGRSGLVEEALYFMIII